MCDCTQVHRHAPSSVHALDLLLAPAIIYIQVQRNIDTEVILQSLRIILKRNIFNVNGLEYLRILRAVMDTKCGHVFATSVVAYLEIKSYHKFGTKLGEGCQIIFEKE